MGLFGYSRGELSDHCSIKRTGCLGSYTEDNTTFILAPVTIIMGSLEIPLHTRYVIRYDRDSQRLLSENFTPRFQKNIIECARGQNYNWLERRALLSLAREKTRDKIPVDEVAYLLDPIPNPTLPVEDLDDSIGNLVNFRLYQPGP